MKLEKADKSEFMYKSVAFVVPCFFTSLSQLAVSNESRLYISINSFTDIIYFVSKDYDIESVKHMLNSYEEQF